jgi:hypothetical protein
MSAVVDVYIPSYTLTDLPTPVHPHVHTHTHTSGSGRQRFARTSSLAWPSVPSRGRRRRMVTPSLRFSGWIRSVRKPNLKIRMEILFDICRFGYICNAGHIRFSNQKP